MHTPQSKAPSHWAQWEGGLGCKSLTMTYFHTGTRTIIGAKSFHCPVRDGKEWDRLAMVIRHNWLLCSFWAARRIHRVWNQGVFDCVLGITVFGFFVEPSKL